MFRSLSLLIRILAWLALLPSVALGQSLQYDATGFQVGDRYQLKLSFAAGAEATANHDANRQHKQTTRYDYNSIVEVEAVDGQGRVERASHWEVRLDASRPGGAGTLLDGSVHLVVHWDADDRLRIYRDGHRAPKKLERLLAEVLANEAEWGIQASIFEPAASLSAGESWPLHPGQVKELLKTWGLRVVTFDGVPQATLAERDTTPGKESVRVRYQIPVSRFRLMSGMPENTTPAATAAVFEGSLQKFSDKGAIRFESQLTTLMNGVRTSRAGMSPSLAWETRGRKRIEQRVDPLPSLAEGRGPKAEPARRQARGR